MGGNVCAESPFQTPDLIALLSPIIAILHLGVGLTKPSVQLAGNSTSQWLPHACTALDSKTVLMEFTSYEGRRKTACNISNVNKCYEER
jgi:hypothetical protein